MKIEIKSNFSLKKFEVDLVTQIALVNSSQELVGIGRGNAPYLTGTLKKSIGSEPGNISKTTKKVRIGSRKVPYAVKREFQNNKNPDRKYYMRRTADKAPEIVKENFEEAIKIVKRRISK